MRHKTATTWLVILTVIVTLDVAIRLLPREAAAQEPELTVEPQPVVRIIEISATIEDSTNTERLYRLWSHGTIERNARLCSGSSWCGWEVVADVPAP